MNLSNIAPDVVSTIKRFPFATFLIALATIVFIGLTADFIADGDETAIRLVIGLVAGSVFALAGTIFVESKPSARNLGAVLVYLVPILVIGAMQLGTYEWIMPAPLFAVGFLWLSVSGFTQIGEGTQRERLQNKFWWINHRAVATGVIAFAGFCIISVGLIAIERSISVLFGMSSGKLFFGYLLPFTGMFLTPLYWFSTIPKLDEFRSDELDEPDFLSRAIGFLGQFVLVPLLLAYSAILLAYALQIVVIGGLPEGTIGWMVLGYLVTGAATWLVLHPPFMREKQIVRLFRRFWFWLTIVPLTLYAVAVFIRIDAYGLTQERVLLVAGGLWAILLTLAFLTRRFADIRIIPALAGIILLLISIGPWNFDNLAVINQFARLNSALDNAGWSADNTSPEWASQDAANARSAFNFLMRHDTADEKLKALFLARGLKEEAWDEASASRAQILNLPSREGDTRRSAVYLGRAQQADPVPLLNTNIYFGDINANQGSIATYGSLTVTLDANQFIINRDGVELARADLLQWLEGQDAKVGLVTKPILRLTTPDANFTLIVTYAAFDEVEGQLKATNLSGMLFADRLH